MWVHNYTASNGGPQLEVLSVVDLKPYEILVVARPSKFKRANTMAALTLRSIVLSQEVKHVLADLPQGFEVVLKQCEKVEDFLSIAKRLSLFHYSESVSRAYEPIVYCLSRLIKEGIKITCYLDPLDIERERELAFKISRLVLRASVKELDERDLKEWVQVLDEYASEDGITFDRLIDNLRRIDGLNVAILAGLEGFQYAERLRDQGLRVRIEAVGLPYLRSPLEVMILKHSRGELTIDELKKLIKEYVDYVRNYVVRSESLEEAHEKWSCNKAPWLKSLALSVEERVNVNTKLLP